MNDPKTSTAANASFIIEQNQRLSRSRLWKLQRNFFEQQGVAAWSQDTVPHYITSNPFIANAYAKVVFGFLRDCYAAPSSLDLSQPVYFIELGAGSGRFAYLFMKKFLGLYKRSVMSSVPFKYIITDLPQQNIDYWNSHPRLQAFVESGKLDFARFDATKDKEIQLVRSGEILCAQTVKNPVVVLANYFFDSIPQDCFYIKDGQLYESLVTLSTPQGERDMDDPAILDRVQMSYQNNPVTAAYYSDEDFNQLLGNYQQQLTDTSLLFPCFGLECIRNFRQLAGGRLLLLSGDKGYNREESLHYRGEPVINVHGSFSMMVNYHAIGQYVQSQGGKVLHASHYHPSMSISAFLWGDRHQKYVEIAHAYEDAIEKLGPDDFFTLTGAIEKNYENFSTEEILAYLRLSGWDPNIMLGFFPILMSQMETADEVLNQEIYEAIGQVWDCYYPIGEQQDLAFYLGLLLGQMQYYGPALQYFQESLKMYGTDSMTLYNMGMCYYHLGERTAALDCTNQSLELFPEFEPAQELQREIMSMDS